MQCGQDALVEFDGLIASTETFEDAGQVVPTPQSLRVILALERGTGLVGFEEEWQRALELAAPLQRRYAAISFIWRECTSDFII